MPTAATDRRDAPEEAVLRRDIRAAVEAALGDDADGLLLYGSRARGDFTAGSDWDVLVLLRDTADLHAAGAMLRTIRSDLMVSSGESVHLFPLRWADADRHGGLIRNVVREGKRL